MSAIVLLMLLTVATCGVAIFKYAKRITATKWEVAEEYLRISYLLSDFDGYIFAAKQ